MTDWSDIVKQLHIGVFDNPQANDTGMALWRHPENQRMHFDRLDYWTELAGICEDAHLDFLFLADAWGWAEINGERPDICSVEGLELPRLDPAAMAAALVPETTNLGLVITAATTFEQPYSLARRLATIDQISDGRLGWNIVTSGTADTAALAFGTPQIKHDDRYDMADDFMEVVYKLWEGCWEPDALVRDKDGRLRGSEEGSPHRPRRPVLHVARVGQRGVDAPGNSGPVPGGKLGARPAVRRDARRVHLPLGLGRRSRFAATRRPCGRRPCRPGAIRSR